MSEIKKIVDVNTIVGDAIITPDGSTVIPVSKVSLGFVSGGGEYGKDIKDNENNIKFPFVGGGGAGMTLNPIAFVVVKDNDIRLLNVNCPNVFDSFLENIPCMIGQIVKIFSENSKKNDDKEIK